MDKERAIVLVTEMFEHVKNQATLEELLQILAGLSLVVSGHNKKGEHTGLASTTAQGGPYL